jgi:hypothetical protein
MVSSVRLPYSAFYMLSVSIVFVVLIMADVLTAYPPASDTQLPVVAVLDHLGPDEACLLVHTQCCQSWLSLICSPVT